MLKQRDTGKKRCVCVHNFVILYYRISPLPILRVMYFKLAQNLRPGVFRPSNAVGKFIVGVVVSRFLFDKFSVWFHSDLFNLTEFIRIIPTTDWGVEVVKAELRFRLPDRGRTSPDCVWFLYFEPLCHKFNLSSVFYCFRIFFDFWWCVKLCYHYRGLLTLIWILRCSELPSCVSSKLTLKCWRIHKGKERSFN